MKKYIEYKGYSIGDASIKMQNLSLYKCDISTRKY